MSTRGLSAGSNAGPFRAESYELTAQAPGACWEDLSAEAGAAGGGMRR